MHNMLEINNLSKNYGSVKALQNVSFTIPQSTVFGILGPNGSGKTTLLGILMNTLLSSSGSMLLFGETPNEKHRKRIGTLLETPNFYHYMNAVNNLKIAAVIKGIAQPDIDGVLKTAGLYERRNSPFSSYSLGMKQRLAIASCLLGDPDVMVLDEPTNGLDPKGIAEIRQLIMAMGAKGKTIIMASHMLDEVEKVCTHMAILKKGTLLASGHVDEILANDDIVEIGAADAGKLMEAMNSMKGQQGIFKQADRKLTVHFKQDTVQIADINQHCFEHGVVLNHLLLKRKSLEAKFMELTT